MAARLADVQDFVRLWMKQAFFEGRPHAATWRPGPWVNFGVLTTLGFPTVPAAFQTRGCQAVTTV